MNLRNRASNGPSNAAHRSLMQTSSVFSVNRGTSLCLGNCLGIVWAVQISRAYQLNEGQ